MENTSYVSNISYKIENWLYKGLCLEDIQGEIDKLKEKKEFPNNLVLVDAYFDRILGSSGCAFLDVNTGETIVGFAGTNLNNSILESAKDIITDGIGLGVTGIHNESPYMIEANKFINDLKEQGYNITQSTGHSLGGALCVYIGVNHDIPLITTYNGAPLYVLPSAYITGNAEAIKSTLKNYDGKIIRFVSDKDWLNGLSDAVDGFYIGEEFLFHNGAGHDLKFFLNEKEQKYISSILSANKFNAITVSKIDFDKDNQIDLELKYEDLIVKNLLGEKGLYSGNGVDIKIDADAFFYLQENIKREFIDNDIEWINKAINLCKSKNDSIKNSKNKREDMLCNKIVDGLNEASLTKLLSKIGESHGKLIEKKSYIDELSGFDTYAITRNFDMWGTSGGRRWFLDGEEFDEYSLINWIKDLKESSRVLYHQIITTGEFSYYNQYSGKKEIYKFDTLSDIGKSFVNVTNRFLSKVEEVFDGIGLREGKNDGIVISVSEVLDVQGNNIDELRKKFSNIAEISGGLAENFSNMDKWLSKAIYEGNINGKNEPINIHRSYTAYLKENKIFDDVKDVIEAYDLQVESGARKLSRSIISDFEDLISRSQEKLRGIYNAIEDFRSSVNNLEDIKEKYVTSVRYKTQMEGYNTCDIEEIKENHGKLSEFFPINILNCMDEAKNSIVPIMDSLYDAIYFLDLYDSEIHDLKEYFISVIEKAVYDFIELKDIIEAQNLIHMRLKRMIEEIKRVIENIDLQFKGNSLESYKNQLNELINLLSFINLMINDCFGENS